MMTASARDIRDEIIDEIEAYKARLRIAHAALRECNRVLRADRPSVDLSIRDSAEAWARRATASRAQIRSYRRMLRSI
jgi:hypothetical protein